MELKIKYNELNLVLDAERAEKKRIQQEFEFLKLHCAELEATNNHLVAATWRERDLKRKLSETIEELNKTKVIVETQNRRITESINYARKIQLAINSNEHDLKSNFPESFILYLPKDVISGDFPWVHSVMGHIYVGAIDCTGHGVPGAMMSMIGNLLLNDIANGEKIISPSQILKNLHQSVVHTLKQEISDNNSNDGMDVALSLISPGNSEITFSGAHRPLFILRDNKVEVIAGDKFPIGGMHYKGRNSFTDTVFRYKSGDTIFLFTDGLPDQVGGERKTKLMVRNLKTFIETHGSLPMAELKERLYDFYINWKGENKQIDDILIIAIRLQ